MSSEDDLKRKLEALSHKWNDITDIPETPRSVMSVIEHSLGSQRKAEVYTNRILRYFLDSDEPHGMDDDFLQEFLDALPDECGFDEDSYDLSNVEVDDQVRLQSDSDGETEPAGEVDLVIESPNKWFLMVEIKFSAGENSLRGEGLSQTQTYYEASHIDGVPRDDYESGGYYLYLHPNDEPRANENGFTNRTWGELVDDVLETLIVENSPRYPQRTVTQLREFADDIQEITGMTERQENEREKVELYLEHYEAIKDVTDTFDERWEEFAHNWANGLAEKLREDGVVRFSEPEGINPEQTAVVELNDENSPVWVFRAKHSKWAYIFKKGWWRHTDDLNEIYDRPDDGNDVRVGFHHNLGDNHQDEAIRNRELMFYFRNMGRNDREFRDTFKQKFGSRKDEIGSVLPETAETTGNKGNMTEAVYDIRVDEHDDIFGAYVEALERAFVDHVVENAELVSLIDEAYEDAVGVVYGD
jgi:hypothetical protein